MAFSADGSSLILAAHTGLDRDWLHPTTNNPSTVLARHSFNQNLSGIPRRSRMR
jgi:hypothetical protein